jgi:cyclophilin family peptidyl-prolyl cis-trans isomerase
MKKSIFFLFLFTACTGNEFNAIWTKEKAPDVFLVQFETSKGNFEAEINRHLSPLAVDRFYQLVRHDYFSNAIFYRVVPNFVAQFGNSDSSEIKNWREYKIPDEKVIGSNEKGTISFARDGKDSRNVELYINLEDNLFLDTIFYNEVKGFPVIGKVTQGMETVEALYDGYGDKTMEKLETFYQRRSEFLRTYSDLDSILKIKIIRLN